MNDRDYMQLAISLARKGSGWVNPNPMVGAVIVKNGRVIGEGYHRRCGELHAERNAFASLREPAEGATLYVTLEPCCHHGRTPPCTDAILANGIRRVFIGSRDPNPLVHGKGAAILQQHGIQVIDGFMKEACDALNPVFFHYITTGRPYVAMKYAMTLDGKIASYTGASKWITGQIARNHVHRLRGQYSAILAGIGTVRKDNPMLNCRISGSHQPLRVIADSALSISPDAQICKTAKVFPTLIVCAYRNEYKANILEQMGVQIIDLPDTFGKVDLRKLMNYLGSCGIDSVLIEGGGTLNEAALKSGIVTHVYAYIAPKLMGGKDAKTPVEGLGASMPALSASLKNLSITHLEEDLLLEYDLVKGLNHASWEEDAICLQE